MSIDREDALMVAGAAGFIGLLIAIAQVFTTYGHDMDDLKVKAKAIGGKVRYLKSESYIITTPDGRVFFPYDKQEVEEE